MMWGHKVKIYSGFEFGSQNTLDPQDVHAAPYSHVGVGFIISMRSWAARLHLSKKSE